MLQHYPPSQMVLGGHSSLAVRSSRTVKKSIPLSPTAIRSGYYFCYLLPAAGYMTAGPSCAWGLPPETRNGAGSGRLLSPCFGPGENPSPRLLLLSHPQSAPPSSFPNPLLLLPASAMEAMCSDSGPRLARRGRRPLSHPGLTTGHSGGSGAATPDARDGAARRPGRRSAGRRDDGGSG
jgi:hypothetical protein